MVGCGDGSGNRSLDGAFGQRLRAVVVDGAAVCEQLL
jgi:hypothetical protein